MTRNQPNYVELIIDCIPVSVNVGVASIIAAGFLLGL